MKRPCELGENLCVDIVFLRGIPILHAVDRYSTFSATQVLTSPKSPKLVYALDVIVNDLDRISLEKTLKRPEYPVEQVKIGDFVRF
jgi:hypothetical protein